MKRFITTLLLLTATGIHTQAQSDRPFKGHLYNADNRISLHLDLYDESLEAPGLSFLGKMHGYMCGNIYGTWMLVSHKIDGNKARLRFSNDQGSDSQTIVLTATSDSTFTYEAIDGNNIRKAVGRKLVKIPAILDFKRK